MVSNEVSTGVDLYSSCLRCCEWAGIAPPMFHFAMGWNCSAHVSFHNGLELLSPCFISQWAGIAPPIFHFTMGWNCSAHVLSCWCSTGLMFRCLMTQHIASARPCEWLEFLRHFLFFSMVWIQPVEVDQRQRALIILTDSSPVFSCSGHWQLRSILSSKPLINRRSRRRRS